MGYLAYIARTNKKTVHKVNGSPTLDEEFLNASLNAINKN